MCKINLVWVELSNIPVIISFVVVFVFTNDNKKQPTETQNKKRMYYNYCRNPSYYKT